MSPYSIERVSKRALSTAHHDTKPVCGPLPLCHCLPRSPQTRCPAAAGLCQRLASCHTPSREFQNVRRARSTAHHDTNPVCGPLPLCHCLPRSPQTRCPAAAVLCQRLASRHTPFRGFQNVREARPITTQNPSVGLYRFATAFPSHCEHVAMQWQAFASAWPVAILHLEGFKTCDVREARPITTQNPSVGLYRFATAFPSHCEHVALQRQAFASAMASRHTPFRGFQNVREARPITTQNPSVGLYRFATALSGHRKHVALQQSFASAWPCRHTPFRGFQNVREARSIRTQNPSVGLYRFATAFPGHRKHVALQRQAFASAWPVAILHPEGFKTEARPITTQTPSVGLYRFAAAFPGHRKHVALQRQAFASAWPVAILHLEGFKTCDVREARPITTQTPSVGLYRFATAFPGHRKHVALQQSFASAWPVAILHLEGFKTCAKHGPSRHKTPL